MLSSLSFKGNALTGGYYGINLNSLLDVVVLTGFAFALVKGRLWAAYGLLGYGLLDGILKEHALVKSPGCRW